MQICVQLALFLLFCLEFISSSMSFKPIDSHLHVWSDGKSPFDWAGPAVPEAMIKKGSAAFLIGKQLEAGVDGALIVQPINHKFDHSFVLRVLAEYPQFKGMCLLDPECDDQYLIDLKEKGFVGVRFNPYLFPAGTSMSSEAGSKRFEQCGKLGLPVGFMCFKGLDKHIEEIQDLTSRYPETTVVIDHWGFHIQDGSFQEDSWNKLLSLSANPKVHVKISAAFRNVVKKEWPYEELTARLGQLVQVSLSRSLGLMGQFLYTGGVLCHVHWFIRQL